MVPNQPASPVESVASEKDSYQDALPAVKTRSAMSVERTNLVLAVTLLVYRVAKTQCRIWKSLHVFLAQWGCIDHKGLKCAFCALETLIAKEELHAKNAQQVR